MSTEEKKEFNENLKKKLLQCGFKHAGESDGLLGDPMVYEIKYGGAVTVYLDKDEENYLIVKKDHSVKHKEHYNLPFEQIKAIVLRHTGHELKQKKYDWGSCIDRLTEGYYVFAPNSGVNHLSEPSDHERNKNIFPKKEQGSMVNAFTQLLTVVDNINKDFPKGDEEESHWPYVSTCDVVYFYTRTIHPFEIYSLQGYEAFVSEPSNIELLKQFQGIK